MSASITGLWGLLSKPKSEEKRRPKRPEDPEWKGAKVMAALTFAYALSIFSAVGTTSAINQNKQSPKEVAAILFAGWMTKRAYKNMRDTFKAAKESGDYAHKSRFNIVQPPLATTINLSTRENYNVWMGQTAAHLAHIALPQAFVILAPVILIHYAVRNMTTHPEGDQGHFRPKWLRDVMNSGGDKGGPSGP